MDLQKHSSGRWQGPVGLVLMVPSLVDLALAWRKRERRVRLDGSERCRDMVAVPNAGSTTTSNPILLGSGARSSEGVQVMQTREYRELQRENDLLKAQVEQLEHNLSREIVRVQELEATTREITDWADELAKEYELLNEEYETNKYLVSGRGGRTESELYIEGQEASVHLPRSMPAKSADSGVLALGSHHILGDRITAGAVGIKDPSEQANSRRWSLTAIRPRSYSASATPQEVTPLPSPLPSPRKPAEGRPPRATLPLKPQPTQ